MLAISLTFFCFMYNTKSDCALLKINKFTSSKRLMFFKMVVFGVLENYSVIMR